MFPDSKQDIRKLWYLQCIVQEGMRLCKKKKEKCAILRLILNILPFSISVTSLFHK